VLAEILMDYNQIIKYFLSTSVITVGLVYLAKLIIDKFAEARFEKYKTSLQKETDSFRHGLNFEAEKFRHELNTTATEHQIRYSKLYGERGQVIKTIYNLLLELENSLANLTSMFQGAEWTTESERDKIVTENIKKLRSYLEQNRIFFSEALCSKIETILTEAHQITVDMYMAKRTEIMNENYNKSGHVLGEQALLKPLEIWQELDNKVQKDIKAARLDLAQEFRTLIGVS
jgi:Zn-dependent oligopeptidase